MTITMKVLKSREEWLAERRNYIGGSEASAVIGYNPYQSNIDLWELKTGRRKAEDISNKPYVLYGTKAEEHLRELFKLDFPQYKVEYVENNMFFNDKYPFAHASLDGWLTDADGRRGILEIKTTEIKSSMQRENWNGQIPNNYYVQVLHYMMVLEADFAILKGQLKSNFGEMPSFQTKHYSIERSEVEDDIQILATAEKEFYQHIKNDTLPNRILPQI